MPWLGDIIVAQADAQQLSQALAEAISSEILRVVGGGGGGALLVLVAGYALKMWLERPERALKAGTRHEIKAQTELMTKIVEMFAKIVDQQELIARSQVTIGHTQEKLLIQIDESRRDVARVSNQLLALQGKVSDG